MSDYGLKTDNDFNGPISNFIKVIKACEKAGIEVKDVINVLRRPVMEDVLKEINTFILKKSQTERAKELLYARAERAKDFGIGE